MTALISGIHAKASAIASKTHAAVKSHTLTVVYMAVLAAILIPLGSHVYHYWKPVVESYRIVVVPSGEPAKAVVRRGP